VVQVLNSSFPNEEDDFFIAYYFNIMTWGFVVCGPNEALVVSGCCHRKPLLVPGGRAFVWPGIQHVQRLRLNTITLQVTSTNVYSAQGVSIAVTGIAQVKIQGQNEEMLLAACEQFLSKTEEQIQQVALETLEGHQRAIMGSMTVEVSQISSSIGVSIRVFISVTRLDASTHSWPS